jgi:hypothetical protein
MLDELENKQEAALSTCICFLNDGRMSKPSGSALIKPFYPDFYRCVHREST